MNPPFTRIDYISPKVVSNRNRQLTFTCSRCDGQTITATVSHLFARLCYEPHDPPRLALRKVMAEYQNIEHRKLLLQ